jgi:hypothetical protein
MSQVHITGIEKLGNETKAMFYDFFEIFIGRQGTEGKETIKLVSVKLTRDKANGEYLKFDYEMFGRKCWLHVKSASNWY